MEKEILKEWMERFFLAELTVDEERELCQFLCANEVPAELRKDKEVIIALCGTPEEDIALPEGAAERLEAMLDGLEEMKTHLNPSCKGGLEAPPRRRTLPHREGWGGSFLLRAACVAGVVVALFVALPDRVAEPLLSETYEEEDTFDNPEEAMQCLMAAYGDIRYAMNTTQHHTQEACQTLEQSQSIIREMFNMNIN
ncbi:MAG: hypothetical protein IKY72_06165 [Bacteroidaceae bacterium]|nr:hypothetical protein [Bacteroidaceae bacterium]